MERYNRNVIISNIFWKFAERILAQGVTFLVSIVIARILLPDDYGAVAMVMVFIAIANVFVTSGFPNALVQKKEVSNVDYSSSFYFSFLLSLVLYFIIYFSAPLIAGFYRNEILTPVLRVLGLRIVLASINSIQHSYVSRNMLFKKYFFSTLIGTVVSGIVGIYMAYCGYGIWSLVSQYLINTFVDTIVLFITVHWRPKLVFSFCSIKELFRFGWRILFEGLCDTLYGQFSNLIIGKVYTPSDLAYYSKGQQFPSLLVTNITASIGSVLFPAMSKQQDNKAVVLSLLRKSVSVSSYLVYPLLVGLAAVAKPFIIIVLTDKWIETVPYLVVFCILNLPIVAMIPRHQALNAIGRSDVFMNEHIVSRLVAVIILLLTYRISILAMLVGSSLSSIILTLIIAYTSKKYNGYGYREQISDILPTIIGCLIMGLPVFFLRFLPLSNILILILQICIGALIYILYSIFFKLEEFYICKSFINQLLNRFKTKKINREAL